MDNIEKDLKDIISNFLFITFFFYTFLRPLLKYINTLITNFVYILIKICVLCVCALYLYVHYLQDQVLQ